MRHGGLWLGFGAVWGVGILGALEALRPTPPVFFIYGIFDYDLELSAQTGWSTVLGGLALGALLSGWWAWVLESEPSLLPTRRAWRLDASAEALVLVLGSVLGSVAGPGLDAFPQLPAVVAFGLGVLLLSGTAALAWGLSLCPRRELAAYDAGLHLLAGALAVLVPTLVLTAPAFAR
ncbi:MAG: hypothetical protein R3F62_19530 [Planctomycetota bacterium]